MSEDIMRGIVKYIGEFSNIETLNLTWFGGEPLMAVPEMEKLYKKLRRKLKGVAFHSNIITTGFHLTEDSIKALQQMKVTNMQITLDGLKDTHNKIKFTKECDDVFTTVLNNIDKEPVRVYYCCMVIVQNLIMNSTIPAQAGKQFAPAGASGEPSPRRF